MFNEKSTGNSTRRQRKVRGKNSVVKNKRRARKNSSLKCDYNSQKVGGVKQTSLEEKHT